MLFARAQNAVDLTHHHLSLAQVRIKLSDYEDTLRDKIEKRRRLPPLLNTFMAYFFVVVDTQSSVVGVYHSVLSRQLSE